MKIESKVAVITGGGSGMGAATAERLAEQNAKVAILDLNAGKAPALIERFGPDNVIFIKTDVSDPESLCAAIGQTVAKWGRIDICGAIAGILHGQKVAHPKKGPHKLEDFKRVININLVGLFDTVRQCAFYMLKNEPDENGDRGVVINCSSAAALIPDKGQVAYSASKGGVLMMTRAFDEELRNQGIRSYAILPGAFYTPIYSALNDNVMADINDSLAQFFPRRWGKPEEFASLFQQIVENPCWSGGESYFICNGQGPCSQYRT